jgi:hypothetical protein
MRAPPKRYRGANGRKLRPIGGAGKPLRSKAESSIM